MKGASEGQTQHGRRGLSLQRQLFLWLIVPQIVLWAAAGIFTFKLAQSYANREIDASLSTATRALSRRIQPLESGLLIDFPRAAQDILESDASDRLMYMVSSPPGKFVLGNQHLPPIPSTTTHQWGVAEFHDGEMRDGDKRIPVRQAALYVRMGGGLNGPEQALLVQVARSRASSGELARGILLDTVLPLSLLAALLTLVVRVGIKAGLAPLTTLRKEVDGRDPEDLAAIELDIAPVEVRGLAEAVNALLLKVRKSMDTQRRFIDDAAHQLRTPLAGLRSQTELALQAVQDPEVVARLQKVHQSALHSAHLVSQLLTLARSGPEGASTLPLEQVQVAALCKALALELVPRALAAHIDLGIEGGDDNESKGVVLGRPVLLREAVLNLLDNAFQYAGAGATVTLRVQRLQGWVRIQVEDNGPGMSEADRERAFERFYRAQPDAKGSGLGLAIVREIVLLHGGTVALAAARPHGTVVTMDLPLAPIFKET
ncbi:two-component system, OmpR family, sensor histidine kinase TctE [Roseateles sp. YR242]|uniref:sensor histidine kinase n=1 Tax=Roseateles sp. YR242 TaxID=1855305 RepID=UPI0008C66C18|nr:sensor histidine kinase [Roseateles sp. YR242]SEK50402.1 two-component system, OmpR family, sensor histidine kinase TctE [Roseateles sp. YR242]